MFGFLTKDMTISFRKLLAVILIFSSSFTWFFFYYNYQNNLTSPNVSTDSLWYIGGEVVFLIFIAISAFIGSFVAHKINRRKFLFFWIIFGILATFPILFFKGDEFLVIFGILGGLSFGLGFPSCQALIADSTSPEERGRVAGLAILASFVMVIFSFVLVSILNLNSDGILLLSLGIKAIGFLSFPLDPLDRKKTKSKPWRFILSSKDFNYYLLAFVLFNLAAGLVALVWHELYLQPEYVAANESALILRYLGLSVFALIAGVMADRLGRKKPIILGLIMLGAAYAIVGLITTPATYFVNLLLSGFAWGVLMVVYLVVPGDLSFPGSEERYYAIGWLLPIILYIGVDGLGRLTGFTPPIDIFSTILSVILFASILPILYAVETLSESKIRERRFRDYTEKVGKIVQESKK